ncbi:hypothetical protein CSKR_114253 [Clonorchis sinensis]|uniref:Uncharacterized protein n=1 Tax=Clonorchis sinensis TaxID=79923 RepID=A0A3R7CDP3_CLOSI|nr:hypothetical protein CSKR_114253 [Clonorchis sinensis]
MAEISKYTEVGSLHVLMPKTSVEDGARTLFVLKVNHSTQAPATLIHQCVVCTEMAQWLEREFTDRKVHGLGNLAVSQPSCGMAARHRKGVTAEQFVLLTAAAQDCKVAFCVQTIHTVMRASDKLWRPNSPRVCVWRPTPLKLKNRSTVAPFRRLSAVPTEGGPRAWILPDCPTLDRSSRDAEVRGSKPTSASRLPLSRLGQSGIRSALVVPSGGMAAGHRKGASAKRCPHLKALLYWTEFPVHIKIMVESALRSILLEQFCWYVGAVFTGKSTIKDKQRTSHTNRDYRSSGPIFVCFYLDNPALSVASRRGMSQVWYAWCAVFESQ